MGVYPITFETIHNCRREVDLSAYPVAVFGLADDEGGSTAAERVDDQVSWFSGYVDDTVKDFGRERVSSAGFRFEFPMPHRRDVGPYVLERHTVRVHSAPVPTVVLDFAPTMSAGQDRRADAMKGLWFSLAVVEQAVMAWVQATGYRQAGADFDGDPVPEVKPLLAKESPEQHVPFRKVVQEERPARFQYTHAFGKPTPAPLDVATIRQAVIGSLAVFFAKVEGWVRKDHVNRAIFEKRQDLHAIVGEKRAVRGDMERR